VGQEPFLGLAGVDEQGAGGADARAQVLAAEAGQVVGAELVVQVFAGRVVLEGPLRPAPGPVSGLRPHALRQGGAFGHQQLGRGQTRNLAAQGLRRGQLGHREAGGGQIQCRQAPRPVPRRRHHRHQEIVGPLFQQGGLGEGARGHHAHHLALHRPLGLVGVALLLADGHGLAAPHQPGHIGLQVVHRHPGHGDGLAAALAALGQGDVQQRCRPLGIVVEQLVEVPHAVEQEDVRVLRLDAEELLDHGGVGGGAAHGLQRWFGRILRIGRTRLERVPER